MAADARASVPADVTIHDDRAGAPQVESMGVPRDMVILLRQILDGEAVDDGVWADACVEIDHTVTRRLRL